MANQIARKQEFPASYASYQVAFMVYYYIYYMYSIYIDFASGWCGVQSFGGKATRQNVRLASMNSIPTCVCSPESEGTVRVDVAALLTQIAHMRFGPGPGLVRYNLRVSRERIARVSAPVSSGSPCRIASRPFQSAEPTARPA